MLGSPREEERSPLSHAACFPSCPSCRMRQRELLAAVSSWNPLLGLWDSWRSAIAGSDGCWAGLLTAFPGWVGLLPHLAKTCQPLSLSDAGHGLILAVSSVAGPVGQLLTCTPCPWCP